MEVPGMNQGSSTQMSCRQMLRCNLARSIRDPGPQGVGQPKEMDTLVLGKVQGLGPWFQSEHPRNSVPPPAGAWRPFSRCNPPPAPEQSQEGPEGGEMEEALGTCLRPWWNHLDSLESFRASAPVRRSPNQVVV